MDKLKGVTQESKRLRRKFKAVIRINGKLKHLGYFATKEEAHKVYLEALEAQKTNTSEWKIEKPSQES